jgi:DNA-dependent RNA polymerase auxiliary subunit epsilon
VSELEKYVVDTLAPLIPNYEKLDVRANVGDKTYSVEFFATINGKKMQCFDMVDNDMLQEKELDNAFKAIAEHIRSTTDYVPGTINKISFSVSK